MRLRLTVQRQGLPSTFVLWDVRPTSGPQGPGLTISQFLDQVNDVIPLEGGDWGLEDYALEVEGFECLHFTELHNILKEDDQVCIRPLQTTDLRVRRISGRHQISEDGKHLIDGVAFGRPFLRKASRPAVRIPPRKRPRITYDEDDDDNMEDAQAGREVVVRADFENADRMASYHEEEESEDDDFEPDDQDALNDEIRDLADDLFGSEHASQAAAGRGRSTRQGALSPRQPQGLGLLEYFDENGEALRSQYENPLLDKYYHDDPPKSLLPPKVHKRQQPQGDQFSRSDMKGNPRDSSATPEPAERRSSASSSKSVRFKDSQDATPVTILASNDPGSDSDADSDDEDDDDFEPDGSATSDKENEPPTADIEDHVESAKSSDSSSASGSDADSAFSSDSEQADGSSGTSSDESSDSSSLTSSSDSDTDEKTRKGGISLSNVPALDVPTSSSGESNSQTTDLQSPRKDRISPKKSVNYNPPPWWPQPRNSESDAPPFCGEGRTRGRNFRRTNRKRLNLLINKGVLQGGDTPLDAHWHYQDARIQDEGSTEEAASDDDGPEDGEAKLDSIVSIQEKSSQAHQDQTAQQGAGDLEGSSTTVRENLRTQLKNDDTAFDVALSKNASCSSPQAPVVQVEDSLQQSLDSEAAIGTAREQSKDDTAKEQTSPSQPRRARLDVGSLNRLLFGALGLKTPKTPEDASALQAKLMRDTKPGFKPKVDGVDGVDDSPTLAANEGTIAVTDDLRAKHSVVGDKVPAIDDDNWRDKIKLMAVECCYDNITLSEPPFPFVQRWDPQQQYGYGTDRVKKSKKNKKDKKRKRNDSAYYESQYDDSAYYETQYDDSYYNDYYDEYYDESQHKSPRREDYEAGTAEPEFEENGTSTNDRKQDSTVYDNAQDAQAVSDQLMREAVDSAKTAHEPSAFEDLPPIPSEISSCKVLAKEDCKPGAVIAFKKFEMSLEHGWQPYISDHRTARVNGLREDGSVEMTWARRDQPESQKQYDELTGERILNKFEMPGLEEDDEDEDPSKTVVMFPELIEPVLIRSAEDDDTTDIAQKVEKMDGFASDDDDQGQSLQDGQGQAVASERFLPGAEAMGALSDVQVRSSQPSHETFEDGDKQKTQTATLRGDTDSRALEKSDTVIAAERLLDRINGTANAFTETKGDNNNISSEQQPNSPAHHDISQVMREAGWRSSIDPDLKRQMELQKKSSRTSTQLEPRESSIGDIPSPRFHGFSSPSREGHSEARLQSQTPSGQEDSNEQVLESLQSGTHTNEIPPSAAKTDLSIHYPTLPQLDDSSEIYPDQRQHRSSSLYNDHSETTPQPISPPSLRRRTDYAKSPTRTATPTPLPSLDDKQDSTKASASLDGAADESDSDEFPPLFSQAFEARMSQELDIKSEPSSNNNNSLSPAAKRKPKAAPEARSKAKPNPTVSQQRSSLRTWSPYSSVDSGNDEEVSQIQSSQFLPPTQTQQSQIVDLTMTSSDPVVEFDDTFEDGDDSWRPSSSLPAGSGWVGKSTNGSGRAGRSMDGSGLVDKSRVAVKDEVDGNEEWWVKEPGSMSSSAPPARTAARGKVRKARRRGISG